MKFTSKDTIFFICKVNLSSIFKTAEFLSVFTSMITLNVNVIFYNSIVFSIEWNCQLYKSVSLISNSTCALLIIVTTSNESPHSMLSTIAIMSYAT